ncbi:hypothetical protein BKA65DRAFT_477495 [Rhexocercosporidium sp. MPI-PUGE-AT-0058]|nr:hypothetical protein BKA65DRAFT_477495 [Rhexocercosporidium sp. MPI-PUGE-AT-0058]
MKLLHLISVLATVGPLFGRNDVLSAREVKLPLEQTYENDVSPAEQEATAPDLLELSEIGKREDTKSRLKIHLLSASGRVLKIIIIDYLINALPGGTEKITAGYNLLTTAQPNGQVTATFFPGNAFRDDQATFDIGTKAVSGVWAFSMNARGIITSLVNSAGVHLGPLVVATKLKFFNSNGDLIATQPL